jgi:hypothetical protein
MSFQPGAYDHTRIFFLGWKKYRWAAAIAGWLFKQIYIFSKMYQKLYI